LRWGPAWGVGRRRGSPRRLWGGRCPRPVCRGARRGDHEGPLGRRRPLASTIRREVEWPCRAGRAGEASRSGTSSPSPSSGGIRRLAVIKAALRPRHRLRDEVWHAHRRASALGPVLAEGRRQVLQRLTAGGQYIRDDAHQLQEHTQRPPCATGSTPGRVRTGYACRRRVEASGRARLMRTTGRHVRRFTSGLVSGRGSPCPQPTRAIEPLNLRLGKAVGEGFRRIAVKALESPVQPSAEAVASGLLVA